MKQRFASKLASKFRLNDRKYRSGVSRGNPRIPASKFKNSKTWTRRRKTATFRPFNVVETHIKARIGQKLLVPPRNAENPTFPGIPARPNPPKSPHVPDQHYCRVTLGAQIVQDAAIARRREGAALHQHDSAPCCQLFMKCSILRDTRGPGCRPLRRSPTSRGSRTARRPNSVGGMPLAFRNRSTRWLMGLVMRLPFQTNRVR